MVIDVGFYFVELSNIDWKDELVFVVFVGYVMCIVC